MLRLSSPMDPLDKQEDRSRNDPFYVRLVFSGPVLVCWCVTLDHRSQEVRDEKVVIFGVCSVGEVPPGGLGQT